MTEKLHGSNVLLCAEDESTSYVTTALERPTYGISSPYQAVPSYIDIPFFSKQVRIALRNCGMIDPENICEYIARGGYEALSKALFEMQPQEVIDTVRNSGLRGRGGAGFLTGLKWELTAHAPSDKRYVVCNADEGDPGAFMDRAIIEGDPHAIIEGMTLCAYAIGADEGYIYCRAEYPLAIHRLGIAIAQAEEHGLLGDDILGTGFCFHLSVKEGAGAFVCGEETALLASIEGRRGEPRPRPPYPSVKGLWGKPTNLNNVKSYANVPQIISNGAEWFASIGPPRSPGTAIFALTGKVNTTGLVEVPMGITLGEIVYDIGGGIPGGKKFKAVQTGGPLGGCIPVQHLNVRVDFESLKEIGAVMGSGGMIVVDEDTCMVEFSKFFLTFAQAESCGKCTACRAGGRQMLDLLTRITEGGGRMEDLDTIEAIAAGMKGGALCALGQLTPGPVLAALRYFRDEFEAHILDKRCPAGVCQPLVTARCTNGCPAEVDVPGWVALVAQGRTAEAIELHRRKNPFVLSCGRVCPAFCEDRCRRAELDEPIAIRQVKRYMADQEMAYPWTPPKAAEPKGQAVAVIGGGPAGLTAALRLSQMGYPVTLFEKLPVLGGMMAVGIPEYRLPRDVLAFEIEGILRAGVHVQLNSELGRDFTLDGLLEDGYSAAILAIGAHHCRTLGIPGEDSDGVCPGVAFLRDVALGHAPDLTGKRVGVVGGGNVALDAARTAWRLGASQVSLIYRRQREQMPAYEEEIEAALEEGIQLYVLTNPIRVLGNRHVTGVECLMYELGEFDSSGRRRPVPLVGSEFVLGLDVLIPAIGQEPDLACLDPDLELCTACGMDIHRDSTLIVDRALATSRKGVFAAGDAVLGPATVVEAVAQGNQVARSVDRYLRTGSIAGEALLPGYEAVEQLFDVEAYSEARRPEVMELPVERRELNFREVEQCLPAEVICQECKRCLRCDLEWLERMRLPREPVGNRRLEAHLH